MATTKAATAGEEVGTWKIRSDTELISRRLGLAQRKKDMMFSITGAEKHGEEKGGVTQNSPAASGIRGGLETVEENREST
jgi:hypothetical protein